MNNKNVDKKNLMEIVFLQTIGPLLVIFGHIMNGLPYLNFYKSVKSFIYTFHMPLFFFIAGFLFYYTNNNKKINYFVFIKKKFNRLLVPYLFWNTLFIFPKYLLSYFLTNKIVLDFNTLLINYLTPRLNIWCHMWFLFAIFLIYCIAPYLKKIYDSNKKIFLLFSLIFCILSIFPIETDFLALADITKNTIYFIFGMFIFNKKDIFKKQEYIILTILCFVISFVFWLIFENRCTIVCLAFSTIMVLFIIGLLLSNITKNNIISDNSMFIYLFHWPVMITFRIVLYQILNINYVVVSLVMFIVGILGPLIGIAIINKFKLKEKYKFIKNVIGG